MTDPAKPKPTAGPWKITMKPDEYEVTWAIDGPINEDGSHNFVCEAFSEADAELIVRAPDLAAEVERLREAFRRLVDECDGVNEEECHQPDHRALWSALRGG